ncbi:MAG: BrnT family toxin [Aquificales bacterium]|nr:BrnT family toxin [Aquificales bacterium]
MNIDKIVVPLGIQDKLISKHQVQVDEVRQVLLSLPRIRFAEKGHIPGEDVYSASGQTFGGRYLIVFFVFKPTTKTAIVISGRDMARKERKQYGKK